MGMFDEPVRGQIPPPWFLSVSGLERLRLWFERIMPPPPVTRQLGSRLVHYGPGLVTQAMPTGEAVMGMNGQADSWHVAMSAIGGAQCTALQPGYTLKPLAARLSYFRPVRTGSGRMLARARVVNASRLFVYAEVMVEDSDGRQIAHGGGHAALVPVVPAPPPPPSPIEPLESPTWPTLDPYQRPFPSAMPMTVWQSRPGLEVMGLVRDGQLEVPLLELMGARVTTAEKDRVELEMPASERFCLENGQVSTGPLATLASLGAWSIGLSRVQPGDTMAGLDSQLRFHSGVNADGRALRVEASLGAEHDGVAVASARVHDADGRLLVSYDGSAVIIDDARRRRPARKAVDRALCAILFTDIVDSTSRASQMGETAWRQLLERHDTAARRDIAVCDGTVVKTTGDGFLVRFSSTARAVDCARRLVRSLGALDIPIRAGLHAGECEIYDDDVIGMAVHLASRIEAAAAPGEVLVSSVVRDLAAGDGLRFEDRGEHQLKGVDDPWRLWAAV